MECTHGAQGGPGRSCCPPPPPGRAPPGGGAPPAGPRAPPGPGGAPGGGGGGGGQGVFNSKTANKKQEGCKRGGAKHRER